MKFPQVMIDLETLSTENNAAIVSIGAVLFDEASILSEFKVNVSAASCKAAGLHFSLDTINWWAEQKHEARQAWMENPVDLKDALLYFRTWYGENSMPTYGNGSIFDIVIMESAFKAVGVPIPWSYRDVMCLRTIATFAGVRVPRTEGLYHDALVDARNQTKFLLGLIR